MKYQTTGLQNTSPYIGIKELVRKKPRENIRKTITRLLATSKGVEVERQCFPSAQWKLPLM